MLNLNTLNFMKRTKFTVGLRNKLSELAMSFDSAACISDGGLSPSEREDLQNRIRALVKEIDDKIFVKDE